MKRYKIVLFAILGLALSLPAIADRAAVQTVMAAQTVSTAGGEVTKTVYHPGHARGYLLLKTTNEVTCIDLFDAGGPPQDAGDPDGLCDSDGTSPATASLAVQVKLLTPYGDVVSLCTLAAIETNTVTTALLGSDVNAAGGVNEVCDFPMGFATTLSLIVTGIDASIDVAASIVWLPE